MSMEIIIGYIAGLLTAIFLILLEIKLQRKGTNVVKYLDDKTAPKGGIIEEDEDSRREEIINQITNDNE